MLPLTVCEEGDLGQTFFVILSGHATVHSVHHHDPTGRTSTHRCVLRCAVVGIVPCSLRHRHDFCSVHTRADTDLSSGRSQLGMPSEHRRMHTSPTQMRGITSEPPLWKPLQTLRSWQ